MKKVLESIWAYLKDWRNWLSHGLVGVVILAVGLLLPVKPIYRIIILFLIIGFNIIRMKVSEKNIEINSTKELLMIVNVISAEQIKWPIIHTGHILINFGARIIAYIFVVPVTCRRSIYESHRVSVTDLKMVRRRNRISAFS